MKTKYVYPQVQELRPASTTQSLRERAEGRARNGTVALIDFDEGIVHTIGGEISTVAPKGYFVSICDVNGPTGSPQDPDCCNLKVPIYFAIPEDVFSNVKLPLISVRREGITADLSRWHPGQLQYRTPAYGSLPLTYGKGKPYEKSGFSKYEQRQMAVPYQIAYTISIIAKYRGGYDGAKGEQANEMFTYLHQILQPHFYLYVKDSEQDWRTYEAECFNIATTDSIPEISERTVGFSFSIIVHAELDSAPAEIYPALQGITVKSS